MAKGTPAVRELDRSGVRYTLHAYETDGGDGSYGEAVAEALDVDPDRLFKTLVAVVDGSPVVAVVPVSGHLSMKSLAKAVGGKCASMADPADAQRLTGYVVGGISPFGQRRHLPTICDTSSLDHATIYVSAGQRGLQAEVAPAALVEVTGATTAAISR